MSKIRVFTVISTIILIIGIYILSFFFSELCDKYILVYFGILVLVLVPSFLIRKREIKEFSYIAASLYSEGNPEKFITLMEERRSKMFKTKRTNANFDFLIAEAAIEGGMLEKAKTYLDNLIVTEKQTNLEKIRLYILWSKYYFETGELARVKILLDEANKLLSSVPKKYEDFCFRNYRFQITKYNIHEGIFLEQARNALNEMRTKIWTRPVSISILYYLGLIEEKEGNYEKAKEYYKTVMIQGATLVYVDNAQERIMILNKKSLTRENEI